MNRQKKQLLETFNIRTQVLWWFNVVSTVVALVSFIAVAIACVTWGYALGPTYLAAPQLLYIGIYFGTIYRAKVSAEFPEFAKLLGEKRKREYAYYSPEIDGIARSDPNSYEARVSAFPMMATFRAAMAWIGFATPVIYLLIQILTLSNCSTAIGTIETALCSDGRGTIIGGIVFAAVLIAVQMSVAIIETVIAASASGLVWDRSLAPR